MLPAWRIMLTSQEIAPPSSVLVRLSKQIGAILAFVFVLKDHTMAAQPEGALDPL